LLVVAGEPLDTLSYSHLHENAPGSDAIVGE